MTIEGFFKGFGLFLILILLLYIIGVFKNPVNVKNVKDLNIPINEFCLLKDLEGTYNLAISFEKSSISYQEKQNLEIYYTLYIKKHFCDVTGSGIKNGHSILDTQTRTRQNVIEENRKVILNGSIEKDTLFLDVRFDTNSTNDKKVALIFPYKTNDSSVLEGTFKENFGTSEGIAKLTKMKTN
jgi:hypothetical protein